MSIVRNTTICIAACCALSTLAPKAARADAGGVSFWLPGMFGSLAAAPSQPGWTYSAFYYHTSVEGGRGVNFVSGAAVVAGLDARADLGTAILTYVFASPVLNGQASVSVLVPTGRMRTTIDATLTGPLGNTISGSRTDTVGGFGDVIWQGMLKWNHGVHNTMVYATGNFPVGAYESTRLANLGIGHWSVDGGAGYTYFNPQTGYEFSVVGGLTYNFVNPDTDYKNGIDFHVDWGASKFLSKTMHIGLVGYAFQQLTGDSGSGARLGDFKSRVFGVGPQVGFIFPAWEGYQGYVNLKGYKEFGHENRPEGWNAWVTLSFSPAAAAPPPTRRIVK
jgi:hypothetical protein